MESSGAARRDAALSVAYDEILRTVLVPSRRSCDKIGLTDESPCSRELS